MPKKNKVLINLLNILSFTKKIDDKYVFMLSFIFNTMLVPYSQHLCKALPFGITREKNIGR